MAILRHCLAMVAIALGWALLAEPTHAHGPEQDEFSVSDTQSAQIWLYQQQLSRYDDPKVIIREKAKQRAAQRMARLDSLRWYGMSNSRPTAASTPYTSMYSPAWQMPGGRPFAWFHTRPTLLLVPGAYIQ